MYPTDRCPLESLPAEIFGEIIACVGCTRTVTRCAAVRRGWRRLLKSPMVVAAFKGRNTSAVIGFLMEVESIIGKGFFRIDGEAEPESAAVRALRQRIDLVSLGPEPVVCSSDGLILKHNIGRPRGFSTMSLYDPDRIASFAAPRLQKVRSYYRYAKKLGLPDVRTRNLLGQFGVLPRAGHDGMAFFVRHPAGEFWRSDDGVSFQTPDPIYIHVSVYDGRRWIRSISDAIVPGGHPLFHNMPYCVLSGDTLICVYAVRFVVVFSIQTFQFQPISLPLFEASSQGQYAVGGSSYGLATLAHMHPFGTVHIWTLNQNQSQAMRWDPLQSINIVDLCRQTLGLSMWNIFFSSDLTPASLHVRAVSRNGEYAIISVGEDELLFLLNAKNSTIRVLFEIEPDAVDHVFQITEPWLPRVMTA